MFTSTDESSSFSTKMNFKLTHNILRVKDSNELIEFYINNFGMTNIEISKESFEYKVNILGYLTNYDENFNVASNKFPSPTFLEFHEDNSSTTTNLTLINSGISNVYWKIGITLYDLDYATNILKSKQTNITNPLQFEDIGYVSHLKDPNGFHIELLQHDFQNTFYDNINNNGRKPFKDNFILGYPTCIGQITLQSNDIDKTQRFYQHFLGMKLLSIQEVIKFGFTLYFFGWTDENPPKSDIKDISTNRQWLWKRPYTIIEIRYFHNQKKIIPFQDLQKNQFGFQGIRIMCNDLNIFIDKIKEENINFQQSYGIFGKEIIIRDPDNVPIYVSQNKNKE